MVYRIFVEKKKQFAHEANSLKSDIISFLGIKNLTDLRLINRYDVENIEESVFENAYFRRDIGKRALAANKE